MIERAATCLENGGKHVLRLRSKPFRTQRSLHSAFWSHGAGDINLPVWWHALLQAPPASPPQWLRNETSPNLQHTKSDVTSFGLLEFLYPVRTLAYIHKYVNERTTILRRHRRSQLAAQRSRTYTSAADRLENGVARTEEVDEHTIAESTLDVDFSPIDTSHLTTGEIAAKFHELLVADERVVNIRQLWHLHERLQELSISLDPGDLAQLFKRLSNSPGRFGLGKTMVLFDSIALLERRGIHYTCTIAAALKQRDLRTAVALHGQAANHIDGSFGSSVVFKYAIEHADWEATLAVWQQYGDHRRLYSRDSNIWDDVDPLPLSQLMEHARGAIDFAISSVEASNPDDAVPARKLALAMLQRALDVRDPDFDPLLQAELVEKAQSIELPGMNLCQAAILQDLSVNTKSREHGECGLNLYRTAREKPEFVPDLVLLQTLSRRCHDLRSSDDMYRILVDYRKHHIDLPQDSHRLLMSQIARHGDFNTVDQLFQEWVDRYGIDQMSEIAPHLLHACYRRGEADRAIAVLENLREKYDYFPNLRAWNIVIATYSRIGNCDAAMGLSDRLAQLNIQPDSTTYGILMGMYARRSDYDATMRIYEQAVSEGVKPSFDMAGSVVLALATNDRFDEAKALVEEVLSKSQSKSRALGPARRQSQSITRMWNFLLTQYAMSGQLDKVFELQNRMREGGVAFDRDTYAALMQCFCNRRLPEAAQKILKVVMPQSGLRPTALHFAIVMSGFLNNKDYRKVVSLQRRMVEDYGIKPTFSTQNTLLRLASQFDQNAFYQDPSGLATFEGSQTENILTQTLDRVDPMQLASLGPTKYAQSNPPNVALQTSYFPYTINIFGRMRSFEKVAETYNRYVARAKKDDPDLEPSHPVEILSALMVSYNKTGEYKEAEKCWNLALEKSKVVARKANADPSQPGWVLYKYRFLLSLHLTRYMHTLFATSRVGEIASVVASLEHAGFQLSTHNWNKYVQVLVHTKQTLPAYQLCEENLMGGWPGWDRFGHFHQKRRIKKRWVPKSWELGRPFPHYETIVYLASAYLDAQALAYGVGKELLKELERLAPKTVEAVFKMPRFNDRIQNALLKEG
ncbi:MAG: hypothetical protein Q9184_002393 [Pyrenodesmia sp. 2 TL-2023]